MRRRRNAIFVGRKEPIGYLSSLLRKNLDKEKGLRIISIYGKSGVGKTFLINKVLQQEEEVLKQQLVLKIKRGRMEISLYEILSQIIRHANVPHRNFKRTWELINGIRSLDQKFKHRVKKVDPRLHRAIEGLGVIGIKWLLKKHHLTPDVLGVEEEEIRRLAQLAGEQTLNLLDRIFKTPKYWAETDLEQSASERLYEDIANLLEPRESPKRSKYASYLRTRQSIRKVALLFIIDDYESLSFLIEEILLDLASKLADSEFNALLVFIGRNELNWVTRWRSLTNYKVESIRLDVFSEEEAKEYLRLKGVEEKDFQSLIEKSHCLPLLLEILSDAYLQKRMVNYIEEYFRRITYHMRPEQKEWLQILCFIDGRIDEDIIAEMVESRETAKKIFEWFKQEGTIHAGTKDKDEDGWAIDPIVRKLVMMKVRQDSRLRAQDYEDKAKKAKERVEAKIHRQDSS